MADPEPLESTDWKTLLRDAAARVGALLLSAGALVGFVSLTGGAILWTRFSAAQLPTDQAMDALPEGELVATGAASLTLFGVLGLVGVLVVYLIDRDGRPLRRMSYGLVALFVLEALVVILVAQAPEWRTKGAAFGAALVPVVLALVVAHTEELACPNPADRTRQFSQNTGWLLMGGALVIVAAAVLVWLLADGDHDGGQLRLALAIGMLLSLVCLAGAFRWLRTDPPADSPAVSGAWPPRASPAGDRFRLSSSGRGVALVLALLAAAGPALVLGELWLGAALGAAVVLGVLSWIVAVETGTRFLWYGIVVFASVPLVGAIVGITRTVDDPQVQALAFVQSGSAGVRVYQGLYVAETDDRLYFASVATEGCGERLERDGGRLRWVASKDVTTMLLAPLESVNDASRTADELSEQLATDALVPSAPAPAAAPAASAPTATTPTSAPSSASTPSSSAPTVTSTADAAAAAPVTGLGGPAIRREFGLGQTLTPSVARPGQSVTLTHGGKDFGEQDDEKRSAQDEDGFGETPREVRVNGRVATVKTWKPKKIVFVVPDDATTGLVTIGCSRSRSAPVLKVNAAPDAKVKVSLKARSNRAVFDSSGSSDRDGRLVARDWSVNGGPAQSGEALERRLTAGVGKQVITLTVTDDQGTTASTSVTAQRLQAVLFEFGKATLTMKGRKAVERLARDLDSVEVAELHGHADEPAGDRFNRRLSAERVNAVRDELVPANATDPPRVRGRAFGEGCPSDPRSGRRQANRRVDVFLLESGARVVPPPGCKSIPVR